MLQKLRGNNSQGFTLIELMIVIAIIGILAAIAIPNFIAYRNKSFCSAAEKDANSVSAGLADYFAIPTITTVPATALTDRIDMSRPGNLTAGIQMSGDNQGAIIGADPNAAIEINIQDGSTRCPIDYRTAMDKSRDRFGYWTLDAGGGTYVKIISP